MSLPLTELVDLFVRWVDTGEVDPRLSRAICDRIGQIPLPELARVAAEERDLVAELARIPGGVRVARHFLGEGCTRKLGALAPSDVIRVVNAVLDELLRRYPEHGLVLWAYKDWVFGLARRAIGLLSEAEEGNGGNVVNFSAKRAAKRGR